MKNFMEEFKKFIARGSVLDMAVGIIIGSAFTAIVNSLVNDMVMPVISLLTGGLDFSSLKIMLGEGEDAAAFCYGSFISAVINFLVISFVIFCFVRVINRIKADYGPKLHAQEEEAAPSEKECPFCKSKIHIDATRCPHCTSNF